MRRVHLRGLTTILKRVLLQAGALNLGLLMRQLAGIGHAPQSSRTRRIVSAEPVGALSTS
jgi:transposase